MYFFVFLGATESFLLSSMAYDRHAAICNPLHYHVVMSTRCCCSLVLGSYLIGFMDSFVNVLCMSRLDFCNSNVIHHFFLWNIINFNLVLHWYTKHGNNDIHCSWLHCNGVSYHNSSVLCVYPVYYPENYFHFRKAKSLLYLCLPPPGSHRLLWHYDIYLFKAK